MGERTCTIDGCDRPLRARGWCATHWSRWKIHGDPLHTERPTWHQPVEVRFFAKVDVSDCWTWTARRDPHGYGQFADTRAHLWLWRFLVGPIPEGMELDHLCRNRGCVNPDHMEPVPGRVNRLRSYNPLAMNARKTHCPKGHPYDEENTRVYRRPGGDHESRYCLACRRQRSMAQAAAV